MVEVKNKKPEKKTTKRVLTIAATPFFSDRGCHMRIYGEAKYLKKAGNHVLICTYHLGNDIPDLEIKRISNVSWYKKLSPGFSFGKPFLDLKLIFLSLKEFKKFKPDLIHAHLFEGLAVAYLVRILAGFRKTPIVLDLQGDLKKELESYNQDLGFLKKFFVWLSRRLINLSDYVLLSSENSLESVKKQIKNQEKIILLRDAVDLDLFSNIDEKFKDEKIQKEINHLKFWRKNKNLLIYTGGMNDDKGVWDVLREFVRISKKKTNWKLVLFGFGDDREKYLNFVRDQKLEGKVFFANVCSYFALPYFLNLADLAIEPKKGSSESSGKLSNYMATGLPIVCFDNEFNRSRLGKEGLYMNNIEELEDFLIEKYNKIDYDLKEFNQEKEMQKFPIL